MIGVYIMKDDKFISGFYSGYNCATDDVCEAVINTIKTFRDKGETDVEQLIAAIYDLNKGIHEAKEIILLMANSANEEYKRLTKKHK